MELNPLILFLVSLVVAVLPFGLIWLLYPAISSTRTGIVTAATTKEAVRQPVFILLLLLALTMNLVNTFIPYFTLGDDVKMLKDCGLATILISSLILAVWTSSTSIADEIEGKTAMTLLSKPITRWQFVLGKYLGILLSVILLFIPVVIGFLLCVYYKVFYDGKESGQTDVTSIQAMASVIQVIPGVALILLEVAVMSAVSVAISTRLPMVVNMVSCLAIFVVGHLTPSLVYAGVFRLEYVEFMARLIATVLPALEVFNIQAAIATGDQVPTSYIGYSALYALAYSTMAILLAFILFEDRDLA